MLRRLGEKCSNILYAEFALKITLLLMSSKIVITIERNIMWCKLQHHILHL